MWCEAVRWRERGELGARRFETAARARRTASLALSNRKEFTTPHNGAINSLQRRYLLSGASDGSAAIFDVQNATEYEAGFIAKHRSILLVDKQHENGHKFVVSMAVWYPVDTGLFVTASFDQYVKVWDTNSTQVVMDFKMPGKVYSAAMSPIATTHMLIATGSADVQVHLCDIASGAFTHTLSGHRGSFELFTTFIFFKDLLCTAEDRQGQNCATAHYGAVTGLRTTTDGMYLLSSGSDSRLRLWDIDSGCNTLVNFEAMRLQTSKPLQLAVTEDPSLVFIPCMASIKAYNLWSGMTFQTFRGHYEPVNCCYYSAQEQELYTGSNDMQILVWSPSTPAFTEMPLQEDDGKRQTDFVVDDDNWSD
uniref:Anaphase-promoting complex subunit 4 WD40 domain-containing protein n=1 Tax=Oryza glumipatula TaxID=40148 RepID=A0A0D9YHM1_9ORYZ